jgi:hypothetical protein
VPVLEGSARSEAVIVSGCVMDERVTVRPPLAGGFKVQVNQSKITTRSGMNDAAYCCA